MTEPGHTQINYVTLNAARRIIDIIFSDFVEMISCIAELPCIITLYVPVYSILQTYYFVIIIKLEHANA